MSTTSGSPRPAHQPAPRRQDLLLEKQTGWSRLEAVVRHAAARPPVEEPRHVRGRGRGGSDLARYRKALGQSSSRCRSATFIALDVWLFLTVLFANFATALAEERGQGAGRVAAQDARTTRLPIACAPTGDRRGLVGRDLRQGDRVVVEGGTDHPGRRRDHRRECASVDESAITGESAPVIREAGGDRSGVTGGTVVLSDRIIVRDHERARANPSSTG